MKRSFEFLVLLGVVAFLTQMRYGQQAEDPAALATAVPGVSQALEELQIPPDPLHSNRFTEINPDYRNRVGRMYENDYLPGAVQSLAAVGDLDPARREMAEAHLRVYIYHWLDAFVEAGGTRSRLTEMAEERLDKELTKLLGDTDQSSYLSWKSAPNNKLAFLFLPPPE